MKKPKISIIVAVYNLEKYILRCLESLVNQTLRDIEIICIDDGSTDNSLNILNEFAEKDARVKVISQDNKGVARARNVGLSKACGEYIQFVDGDDWVNLNLCEKVYNIANRNDSDIVMFNVAFYDNDKKNVIPGQFFKMSDWANHVDENTPHTYKDCVSIFYGNLSAANKIYKKSFIDKIDCKFPENVRFEDHLFHLHSVFCAEKINILNEKHYYYRQNRKNSMMTSLTSTEVVYDLFVVIDLIEEMIRKIGKFKNLKYLFFQFKYEALSHYFLDINFFQKPKYYKRVKEEFIKMKNQSEEYDFSVCTKMGNFYYYTDILNYNWVVFWFLKLLLDNSRYKIRKKVEPIKKNFEKIFGGVSYDND